MRRQNKRIGELMEISVNNKKGDGKLREGVFMRKRQNSWICKVWNLSARWEGVTEKFVKAVA